MSYNTNNRNQGARFDGKGRSGENGARRNREVSTDPKRLPDDFVDQAEALLRGMLAPAYGTRPPAITTSKLRNLMSLIMDVFNTENRRTEKELLQESVAALQMARVRMAYEAGRDYAVKQFIERTNLIIHLRYVLAPEADGPGSRAEFIRFAQYMEALVAYHKFFGGREN